MPEPILDDKMLSGRLRLGGLTLTRRQFLGCVGVVSVMMAIAAFNLNYYSSLAAGIAHRYQTQAEIIEHGFDPSRAADSSTVTYPMWGYGWIYTFTEHKSALMTAQLLTAVIASVLFVHLLGRKASDGALLITGILTAITLPWYCLHTSVALYSPASVLLVSSIALLVEAATRTEKAVMPAVASGLLFGLCLNFRSDFLLMPVGLAALVVTYRRTIYSLKTMSVWATSIALMMVPWAFYTWHTVGEPRVTSTNGGHALFVGLGQLPGNSWGITPTDRDPLMRQIIDRELGPHESTLGLRADAILKREFLQRVQDRPAEFSRKVGYSAIKVISQGAYPGEFLNTASHRARRAELIAHSQAMLRNAFGYFKEHGLDRSLRLLLTMACYGLTILIVLGSFAVAPINAWFGLIRGHLPVLLVLACIAYHLLLQAFVFNLPHYTSSLLLFHIANLGFACDSWTALRVSDRT